MADCLKIHLLATELQPTELTGGMAVVIDVLRASTTMTVALANGAACVIPCGDIETARRLAAADTTGNTLTGGERGGVRIEGYDLDNSPASYAPSIVAGKTIAFTTTNGTRALMRVRGADRVLIGSLVNCHAVADVLQQDGRPIHLVCAGTDGRTTAEDELGAGALAAALADRGGLQFSDSATVEAIERWRAASSSPERLQTALRQSTGGRNLVALGLDADILRAAEVDSVRLVPEYFRETGSIVPVSL
jgi:2-phosphosulfolactate phosphatase